eukprot:s548_g2.t1
MESTLPASLPVADTTATSATSATGLSPSSAAVPVAVPAAPRKPLDLPICSFRGPEVNLPWTERTELPVEQQLEDAVQRLQVAQEERHKLEEEVGSGKYPLTLKCKERRPPAFASRAADAQKMLQIQKDPRFLELQAALQADPAASTGTQGGSGARSGSHRSGAQTARPNFMGTLETKASWKQHFYAGLRMLIETVNMSLDPKMAEKQLEEAYRWYLSSKQPGGTCKAGDLGPDFHDFCADEVLRHPAPPGSAYYTPSTEHQEGQPAPSASLEKVEDVDGVKVLAGRTVVEARLASPKERLKEFSTKALVRPLTARKLKDLAGAEPEPNRPMTPSTTSGGEGLTARSLVSARSTAVTGVSRPTSAMSMARSGMSRGATPTPRSVRGRPQSAASVDSVVGALPHTVEEQDAVNPNEEYLAPYPGTEAEWSMERRWRLRRHQAISDKAMGQEKNAALHGWAERRARVEEEISRTAEATRFQCALAERRYVEPADALEDIEATATCEEEVAGRLSTVARNTQRPEPPRIDVSQPQVFAQVTRFALEKVKPKPLNSRIAHLRRIHAHLIADDSDQEEDAGAEGDAENAMLSAYAPNAMATCRVEDDSDVLAGVCDWWRHLHMPEDQNDGSSAALDEMRFNQLQEVEDIKRVFSARSVPLNVPILERALVMPAHKMNPGHLNGIYLVNTKPDLLSNPFIAKKKKKIKKKRGKGGAKKGNKKSRGTSAKGKKK